MNRDHAALGTHRRVEATVLVGILLAGAGGYGLRVLQERDLPAGSYVIVPASVATPVVERVERTAACRCSDRGADE